MDTIRIETASNSRSDDSSTASEDSTLVRPRPDMLDSKLESGESPIMRLVRTHDRTTTSKPIIADGERTLGLTVTALTSDSAFASQLRAALDGTNELTVVPDVDAAAALAAAGRCPVLITDSVITRGALDSLSSRLRAHDNATAIVVAGNRDQGGLFISLQSSGVIDGFLLKPATAAATQIVIEAATRRYHRGVERLSDGATKVRSRSGRRTKAQVATAAQLDRTSTVEAKRSLPAPVTPKSITPAVLAPPQATRGGPSWSLVAALSVVIAGIAAWFVLQRPAGIDGEQIVAKHLAFAESALNSGRLLDARDGAVHHFQTALAIEPNNVAALRGLDAVASALSRQVQQHMTDARVADAAVALEELRGFQPQYAELPLLESQLRALQERVAAAHIPATEARQAEAAPPQPAANQSAGPRTVAIRQDRNSNTRPTEPEAALDSPASGARPLSEQIASRAAPAPAASLRTPSSDIPALTREVDTTSTPPPVETRTASISPPPLRLPKPTAGTSSATPTTQTPEARAQKPATLTLPAQTTSAPKTLDKYVPPVYPREALSRQMEGWIELSMEIAPSGAVSEVRIEAGEKRQLFGRAALAAVKQWRYEPDPTRVAGQRSNVRLEFKLE